MTILSLFFSFSGRINRQQFWLATLALLLIDFTLLFLVLEQMGFSMDDYWGDTTPRFLAIDTAIFGLLFWPSLAVGYKRLHDRGQSGKIYGLLGLVILLFFLFGALGFYSDQPDESMLFIGGVVVLLIPLLWFLIQLGFLKGDPEPNAYGPPPA